VRSTIFSLWCLWLAFPSPLGAAPQGDYRIGSHDVLAVAVLQAPELNTSVRVSDAGEVSLPLIGSVQASGLTTQQLELAIEAKLREKYIREPEVTVQLTDLQSQPVSVVGAVQKPGVYQLRGARTLLEVISLAGGLAPDSGDTVSVLRRSEAAPAATVEVDLKTLMNAADERTNVAIFPGDVVTVRTAAIVYITGAVKKPGAFATRGNDRITVLRALALGEGALPTASSDAVVLRTTEQGDRVEIPVNLGALMKGKVPDVPMIAQDVLFVPVSGGKVATRVAIETMTRVLTLRIIP
jgi:polysaccharide biosynthesis/export protein